jgi:hypothetical protein
MKIPVALLAALLCAAPALADDAMTAAATRFYAVYGAFHPSDGIPSAGGRAKYAPVLSDRLNKQIADAARAGDRFNAHNKGSPPLLEGDLFTSMFEGATSWKIGACSGDAKAAHCAVALRHDEAKQKPVTWTDTVYLTADQGGWRVDDIGYGAGFAFGNTGKLSQTLKSTMAAAGP